MIELLKVNDGHYACKGEQKFSIQQVAIYDMSQKKIVSDKMWSIIDHNYENGKIVAKFDDFVLAHKALTGILGDDKMNVTDFLEAIFTKQEELNDKTFAKHGITDRSGQLLTMQTLRRTTSDKAFGPNDLPNIWLRNYTTAIQAEAAELQQSLLWKWWSKDQIDMQNVRVEIIDMLHFLVSLAIVSGMDAHEMHRLYMLKHKVNEQRQETGYSQATKTEADNKTVK